MIIPVPEIPKLNSRRIDTIRSRLDDNDYTVNIQQLTSKLIDLEIALTGAPKNKVA